MFNTVLHANDGSEPAFRALALAINIAKQNAATLQLVCVEEIPPMPEYLEEIREARGTAARRFHTVVERARHLRDGRPGFEQSPVDLLLVGERQAGGGERQ